ncbi:MAG TPA: class I SAM-dependent methyltransferase [Mycobacteriales bacterium]|nr:class I SAM-dependent methyltransferase [Mycobacteriales bacterium]
MGLYDDKVLPRIMDRAMGIGPLRPLRARVALGLAGEVVEIGFGTGRNLPYLPATITRLRAVEPSGLSVRLAAEKIAGAPFPVEVVGLDGQRLPIPDADADAVLCTFSLCTIADPVAALREMRRVLRPGGALHLVEHGRAPEARVRVWQDRLTPVQRRIAGGCHLNRDIPELLTEAGFAVNELTADYLPGTPKPFAWVHEGRAVPA